MAAFVFAGVGFYSLSPDVLDTEFCCDGNHSLEGEMSGMDTGFSRRGFYCRYGLLRGSLVGGSENL